MYLLGLNGWLFKNAEFSIKMVLGKFQPNTRNLFGYVFACVFWQSCLTLTRSNFEGA